jgi:hypothetical protein
LTTCLGAIIYPAPRTTFHYDAIDEEPRKPVARLAMRSGHVL